MGETYRVTQEANASDLNGGGPRFGADGGPVDSSNDCTVNAGALNIIVNNEGNWSDVQANDWLIWDIDGVKEHRKVQSVAGANITLTAAVSGAGANKKVRVGGAWTTLGHMADTVAPGDHVYVKGGTSYTTEHQNSSICELQTAGDHDDVIIIEGYTMTPGDGGTSAAAVIDGGDSLKCVTTSLGSNTFHNYKFRNIRCTQSTGAGFELPRYAIQFEHCKADNNASHGIEGGRYCNVYACTSHSNGGSGVYLDSHGAIVCCTSYSNTGYGIRVLSGTVMFCLVKGNGASNIHAGNACHFPALVQNNTIDGVDKNVQGIELVENTTLSHRAFIVNNIICRCSVGLTASSGIADALDFGRCNLLYDTNYDYGWDEWTGNVYEDPLFVDPANMDYRLKIKSPAIRAGWPEFLDIGAYQTKQLLVGSPTNRGIQR